MRPVATGLNHGPAQHPTDPQGGPPLWEVLEAPGIFKHRPLKRPSPPGEPPGDTSSLPPVPMEGTEAGACTPRPSPCEVVSLAASESACGHGYAFLGGQSRRTGG